MTADYKMVEESEFKNPEGDPQSLGRFDVGDGRAAPTRWVIVAGHDSPCAEFESALDDRTAVNVAHFGCSLGAFERPEQAHLGVEVVDRENFMGRRSELDPEVLSHVTRAGIAIGGLRFVQGRFHD